MKEIKTEIIIHASRDDVWKVFSEFEKFPEWNPFIVSLKGNPRKDERLEVSLKLKDAKPMTIKPIVLELVPGEKFKWFGKTPFSFFNGRHYFIIEPINGKQVRFIQGEQFTGWLVNPVLKRIGEKTRNGFIAMNEALKKRLEAL